MDKALVIRDMTYIHTYIQDHRIDTLGTQLILMDDNACENLTRSYNILELELGGYEYDRTPTK